MQETITLAPDANAGTSPFSGGRLGAIAGLAGLAFLWFTLCRYLGHEWSANEQYGYGWFVPFFAAFLFWLRWEDRPVAGGYPLSGNGYSAEPPAAARPDNKQRLTNNSAAALILIALAALLPLRLFEVGNPDWRPLGWIHAAIVVAITLFVLHQLGGRAWVRHFAFPVAFIFTAVPWVTPIEAPIVQGLMRVVAGIATETLALLGIPAQLEGVVIRVANGVVGVSEACSGVRSLQTSLMVALLFGELKRLTVWRRIALVAAAAAIAFVANCARTLFLVWIATERGVSAVDQWHNAAGYFILGAVFLGTIGIATLLAGGTGAVPSSQQIADKSDTAPSSPPNNQSQITSNPERPAPSNPLLQTSTFYFLLSTFFWLLAVEVSVEAWYRVHERDLIPTPAWGVRWPESVPGFRDVKIDNKVKDMLRFDTGRQAMWPLSTAAPASQPNASPVSGTSSMFFFRWKPNATNILRARAHRPDICLPFTGWLMTADHGVRRYAINGNAAMPFRHFTFKRPLDDTRAVTAHAFFCERDDRIPRAEADQFDFTESAAGTWSRTDRIHVVLKGIRNQGQQVLEIILVTQPELSGEAAQAEFAQLVPKIVELNAP